MHEKMLDELEARYGITPKSGIDILTRMSNILIAVYNEDTTVTPRPRPQTTSGITQKVKIGCGAMFVNVNSDSKGVCEVFTHAGKGGGCHSQSEATARLISLALRSGVDTDAIVEQLKGIRCPSCVRKEGIPYTSCPDAIVRVLERVHNKNVAVQAAEDFLADVEFVSMKETFSPESAKVAEVVDTFIYKPLVEDGVHCPECGVVLTHEGGCVVCLNCSYSKCG